MRDFSDRVGAPRSANRFPFDQMTRVGDFFTAVGVKPRVLSAVVSNHHAGTHGRRFATFSVQAGSRVFLVDIDETQSVAA